MAGIIPDIFKTVGDLFKELSEICHIDPLYTSQDIQTKEELEKIIKTHSKNLHNKTKVLPSPFGRLLYNTKSVQHDKDSTGREYCWDTDQGGKRVNCSNTSSTEQGTQNNSPESEVQSTPTPPELVNNSSQQVADISKPTRIEGQQSARTNLYGPPYLPKNLKVEIDKTNLSKIREIIGDISNELLGAMCNAQDRAEVSVWYSDVGVVSVDVTGDSYFASRRFVKNQYGDLCVRNDEFEIYSKKDRGSGYKIVVNQIKALRQAGVKKISLVASGSKGGSYNGYFTWPRLGFSGLIDQYHIDKLPEDIQAQMGNSREVRDLFALPGGKEAWLEYGGNIACTFDLKATSVNMKALKAYIAEREGKS